MSTLDKVADKTFVAMMPGLMAIFDKQGWVVLVWGMVLLPLGFAVQAVGLLRSRAWPGWQAAALLAGSLFIAAPDGMEITNLTAALTLCVALIPEAVRVARSTRVRRRPAAETAAAPRFGRGRTPINSVSRPPVLGGFTDARLHFWRGVGDEGDCISYCVHFHRLHGDPRRVVRVHAWGRHNRAVGGRDCDCDCDNGWAGSGRSDAVG
jgi:hypothetical protein